MFRGALINHRLDDGGSKDLWNVGILLPDYTALQPRRSHLRTHRRENLKSYFPRLTSSPNTFPTNVGFLNKFKDSARLWSPFHLRLGKMFLTGYVEKLWRLKFVRLCGDLRYKTDVTMYFGVTRCALRLMIENAPKSAGSDIIRPPTSTMCPAEWEHFQNDLRPNCKTAGLKYDTRNDWGKVSWENLEER
jgi:hypothetical protein